MKTGPPQIQARSVLFVLIEGRRFFPPRSGFSILLCLLFSFAVCHVPAPLSAEIFCTDLPRWSFPSAGFFFPFRLRLFAFFFLFFYPVARRPPFTNDNSIFRFERFPVVFR